MRINIFLPALLVFVFSLFIGVVHAVQAAPNNNKEIPEISGVYDDPEHPGVKVRVFVHKQKEKGITQETLPVIVCGLDDPNSNTTVAAGGWHLSANLSYNLNPESVPTTVGPSNLANITANGFSDWTSAISAKVTFTRGSDTTKTRSSYDGQNIIAWGRTSSSTLGVTYIRYLTSSGLVVDVDTIMNKRAPWSWSNSSTCADFNSYDAENVMTHELGHWIGLDDEYDSQLVNATMYGYASKGEVKKTTLTSGDIAGAATIYP